MNYISHLSIRILLLFPRITFLIGGIVLFLHAILPLSWKWIDDLFGTILLTFLSLAASVLSIAIEEGLEKY